MQPLILSSSLSQTLRFCAVGVSTEQALKSTIPNAIKIYFFIILPLFIFIILTNLMQKVKINFAKLKIQKLRGFWTLENGKESQVCKFYFILISIALLDKLAKVLKDSRIFSLSKSRKIKTSSEPLFLSHSLRCKGGWIMCCTLFSAIG